MHAYANVTSLDLEFLRLLHALDTATLGRISEVKAASEPNLIVNLPRFLELVEKGLLNFQKIEHAQAIQTYKEDYSKNILPKIEEAQHFIKLLGQEIKDSHKQIDELTDKLLDEVQELKTRKHEEREALIQKRQELKNLMVGKMVLNILSAGTHMLDFFGRTGQMASNILNEGYGVAQSFLNTPSEGLTKLPEGISNALNDFQNYLSDANPSKETPEQKKHLEEKLRLRFMSVDSTQSSWTAFQVDYQKIESVEAQMEVLKGLSQESSDLKLLETAQVAMRVAQTGINFYTTYKTDQSYLNEIDEAIKQNKKEMESLQKYEQKISGEFKAHLVNVQNKIAQLQSNQDKSLVALDVQKWNVRQYLTDIKYGLQQVTQNFQVAPQFQVSLQKIEGALETILALYERIQTYEEQRTFSSYLSNLVIPPLGHLPFEINKMISHNWIMERYEKSFNAFRQWAFPFGSFFTENLGDLSIFNHTQTTDDVVKHARDSLTKLSTKIAEFNTAIFPIHAAIVNADFILEHSASHPFFTWKGGDNLSAISNLLEGEEVILEAHIQETSPAALKFNEIDLIISHKNPVKNHELQEKLKSYAITLTHHGASHYRCGEDFYHIPTGALKIYWTFAKNNNTHKPTHFNDVWDYLSRSKPLLSPYAFWSLKISTLVSQGKSMSFPRDLYTAFKDSFSDIDVHLVGHGLYVSENLLPSSYSNFTELCAREVRTLTSHSCL